MISQMDISKHAKIRCQQRGIPEKDLWIIYNFGRPRVLSSGVMEYQIMGPESKLLISALSQMIKQVETM